MRLQPGQTRLSVTGPKSGTTYSQINDALDDDVVLAAEGKAELKQTKDVFNGKFAFACTASEETGQAYPFADKLFTARVDECQPAVDTFGMILKTRAQQIGLGPQDTQSLQNTVTST